MINAKVLYGDRNDGGEHTGGGHGAIWNDDNVTVATSVFMLVRGHHWLFGSPTGKGPLGSTHNLTASTAPALLRDDGKPLSNMTQVRPGVFQRKYEKTTVQLDCRDFTVSFKEQPSASASWSV